MCFGINDSSREKSKKEGAKKLKRRSISFSHLNDRHGDLTQENGKQKIFSRVL